MKTVSTQTISIEASYEKSFNYLSDPLNQKEWATFFIKDVQKQGNTFIAETPMGIVPIRVEGNIDTGVLDIYLGDGEPTKSRLLKNENGCEYLFTIMKPHDMPDAAWENEGLPGLATELNNLKQILEN